MRNHLGCAFVFRLILFYIGSFFLSSIGLGQQDMRLLKLKDIANVLLAREDMIQTAIVDYSSIITSGDRQQQEEGSEIYKFNKAYFYKTLKYTVKKKQTGMTDAFSSSWNGTSSIKSHLPSKKSLISGPKEPGVMPALSIFYKISFIQPCRCFTIEYCDPAMGHLPNDIWILQKDRCEFTIPGAAYNDTSFTNGDCVLEKLNDNTLRFIHNDAKSKQPHQLIEFDVKANYFPTRVVLYTTGVYNMTKDGLPYADIVADDLREVLSGIYFAFHVKRTDYDYDGEHQTISSVEDIRIRRVQINDKIKDLEFFPRLPKGTEVIDKQKGTMYTVQEDQK